MKRLNDKKKYEVLLIEEEDLDSNLISRLRGCHVDCVIAPVKAQEDEDFLKQVECCISMDGITFGTILYYEHK